MSTGHFAKFSAAYIRGALYAIIAFLGAFIAQFEGMTHETLVALTAMGWAVSWAKVVLATAVTLRAFFDGTLERIKQDAEPPPPTRMIP